MESETIKTDNPVKEKAIQKIIAKMGHVPGVYSRFIYDVNDPLYIMTNKCEQFIDIATAKMLYHVYLTGNADLYPLY